MRVLIFGVSGMVGRGVLRECMRAPDIDMTVTVGRTAIGIVSSCLNEIVHRDMSCYADIERCLKGFDACFFCLGVSSAGMREADYERITYGYTLAAAETLSRLNPGMTFVYVSGSGTDSTECGHTMWARVKGRTENALLRLPLRSYMFRPGLIVPMDGIRSKTRSYRIAYGLARPVLPLLHRLFPYQVVSTREIGQAMLAVARRGYEKPILETGDIRALLRN